LKLTIAPVTKGAKRGMTKKRRRGLGVLAEKPNPNSKLADIAKTSCVQSGLQLAEVIATNV
jgi:hypothetical protein